MKRNIILSTFFLVLVAGIGGLFYWNSLPQQGELEQVVDLPDRSDLEAVDVEYPLYITTMTHMEIGHSDDKDEEAFWEHVENLRYGMDLADEYDAVLTIESEQPFAKANTLWGYNMMKEIMDRGHGVGTHCDLGLRYTEHELSPLEFSKAFVTNKSLVDELIGAENNHGCSGGSGSAGNDWVTAAQIAGFDYVDGIVARNAMAIPYENRPDPIWTDDYILENYHNPFPENLEDRIYLIKLKDLNDFESDEDGIIVVSGGDVGTLATQADGENFDDKAELTKEDVDAFIEKIMEVESYRDKAKVAKLNVYLPAPIFDPENEEALRYFFSETQKLQDKGVLQWASQWDVVQVYLKESDLGVKKSNKSERVVVNTNENSEDLADVYTLFTLNVHDWVYADNSAEAVSKVIDIHEKYNVPVDIYITDPVFQKYVEDYPDLVARLKTSPMVAVSYHVRAPAPYSNGFDDIGGLNKMNEKELYETLTNYEEHKLDLETGLSLDDPGGYQFMKDSLGYAPVVTGISISGEIGNVLVSVYKEKGAQFIVARDVIDLGDEQYGVYVRPEHLEVKLYEKVRDYKGGEDVFAMAVEQVADSQSGPQFINMKYHENNFYLEGTPWWPVYWEDEDKAVPKEPPFDVSIHAETPDFRSQKMQDQHWALYENTVKYASEYADEYHPINAFDLAAML